MSQSVQPFLVIEEDHISLYADSEEYLRWERKEWEQDPDVVFSIAFSIRVAFQHGVGPLARLTGRPLEGKAIDFDLEEGLPF